MLSCILFDGHLQHVTAYFRRFAEHSQLLDKSFGRESAYDLFDLFNHCQAVTR